VFPFAWVLLTYAVRLVLVLPLVLLVSNARRGRVGPNALTSTVTEMFWGFCFVLRTVKKSGRPSWPPKRSMTVPSGFATA
jgi:hypothetical protein